MTEHDVSSKRTQGKRGRRAVGSPLYCGDAVMADIEREADQETYHPVRSCGAACRSDYSSAFRSLKRHRSGQGSPCLVSVLAWRCFRLNSAPGDSD